MKKFYLKMCQTLSALAFFSLLLNIEASSQLLWLEASISEDNATQIIDHTNHQNIIFETPETKLINYNPASPINVENINLDLELDHLNQCNIFTVYQSLDQANESLIWSIEKSKKELLSLTDQRIVDFHQGKFMNFVDFTPYQAQINTYQHYKKDYPGNVLSLGGRFTDSNIPVSQFKGNLAELIIFNQVLAPSSKARLESALAIKYSVALAEGHDYLDAFGEIIWNAEDNKSYSKRVAGLGRSSIFHLTQNQSKSQFSNGYLALGINNIFTSNPKNKSIQDDQSYLIWGDDDGSIEFKDEPGKPEILQRNWKMISERYMGENKIKLQVKEDALMGALDKNEHLWFTISKHSDYSFGDSKHYRMETQSKNATSNTTFELVSAKELYFTFIKAPAVWAEININHYQCTSDTPGSISILPVGGTPPYSISLKNHETGYIENLKCDNRNEVSISALERGQYQFTIIDQTGGKWKTDFHINSNEIPQSKLKSKYVLSEKEIILNLQDVMPQNAYLTWSLPDGNQSNDKILKLSQSGQHYLLVEIDGCYSTFPFKVFSSDNNIIEVSLSPNPTVNGYFKLTGILKESTEYSIMISTIDGKLISTASYPSAKYIHQPLSVKDSGMYVVTLISGKSKVSKHIIAQLAN